MVLFCADCLYGPARLRLEASHAVADDGRACVIASRGEAGDAVATLLTGVCAARLGEEGYRVESVSPGEAGVYATKESGA
jgi:hypothetical protein